MITRFSNASRLPGRLRSPLTLGTLLLLSAVASGQAQSNSPVGTVWDCVISGKRNGIAYLTFSTDGGGTLSGYEILVPTRPISARTVLVTDSLGSNGLGVRPAPASGTTNIYGFFPVNGSWGFDSKGRLIGFFVEVAGMGACTTNTTPISTNEFEWPTPILQTNAFTDTWCVTAPIATNMLTGTFTNQTICYTNQLDCPNTFTNTVNFTGKVVPGKRLTLTGKTSLGTVTVRGVPSAKLNDLSGAWYGVKKQNQTTSFEFLDLTNSLIGPNTYLVSGTGADYSYLGVAGLSSQKKIACALTVLNLDGTYQSTRAVIGPFNSKKLTANTAGVDAPDGPAGATNRLNFQVTKRTALP